MDISVAQADFSLNLLRETAVGANSDISLVISPLSLAIALSMVYAGARGRTANEIRSIIAGQQQPFDSQDIEHAIHSYYGAVNKQVAGGEAAGGSVKMEAANRVYIRKSYGLSENLNQTFIDTLTTYTQGQFESVDFHRTAEIAERINRLVSDATHGRISNLISPEMLDPGHTRLILVNALYFKAPWEVRFPKRNTMVNANFYKPTGAIVPTNMMQVEGQV